MTKTAEDLERIAGRIDDLPTLPGVVARITELMQNPHTSADELGQAVSTDPALAAKVLKLVNSAFYGFPGRVQTISHAIVILGFTTVKNIVLTASIMRALGNKKDAHGFDVEALWRHSIATGAIAKALCKHKGWAYSEEAFIGGILHDLGKLVMSRHAPEEFAKVLKVRDERRCLLLQAEEEVLGFGHHFTGAWLAKQWKLPQLIASAMRYHHDPLEAGEHRGVVSAIHVADILCRALGYGSGGDDRIPIICPRVWEDLDMGAKQLDAFLELADQQVDRASVYMEVF